MSTQATQPSGGSAQTIFSAPFAAGFAFNEVTNNDASYYCSKNGVKAGWLQYDFASPQQVKTYKIDPWPYSYIFSPVAWTFSGRNGNGAWHVLDTQIGHTSLADGEIKSFFTGKMTPQTIVMVCLVVVSVGRTWSCRKD